MQLLFNLMSKEPLTEFIVKNKQIVALNKGIPEASY